MLVQNIYVQEIDDFGKSLWYFLASSLTEAKKICSLFENKLFTVHVITRDKHRTVNPLFSIRTPSLGVICISEINVVIDYNRLHTIV